MDESVSAFFDVDRGSPETLDRLYETLYRELHRLAHARIRRSGDLTLLDTTSLVNEAWLRFGPSSNVDFADRGRFLAYVARVMRAIVIDAVRKRQATRHGGDCAHVEWDDDAVGSQLADHDDEVVRIHESLTELAAVDPRLARVVEMRYFAWMSEKEVAIALGMAVRTVARDWEKARLFLHATLR